MPTTFDPDELTVPLYDDRPERVVKEKDPARQKLTRNNKQRGKRAERKWRDLINAALVKRAQLPGSADMIPLAETRGILGGADVVWLTFAFEVKQRRGDWPNNTVIKNALVQAKNNAGNRTPVVIACKTTNQGTEWRFYNAVGMYMDAVAWLQERVSEL